MAGLGLGACGIGIGGGGGSQTPLSIITSVPVSQWVRSDLGITISTGVSTWADQTVNARNFTQATGGTQPTYSAADATLNNRPTLTFDGVDDVMDSTWTRTAPGTTNQWISAIIKQISWTTAHNPIADKTSLVFALRQATSSPSLNMGNTTAVNLNNGLAIGSWGRAEVLFTNSTSDYIKLKANTVTGANAGNSAGTGTRLGNGASFCNFAIAELIITAGKPTASEIAAIDAYYTSLYGAGLV